MGDQGTLLVLDGKANAGAHFGVGGIKDEIYLVSASVGYFNVRCTQFLILFSTLSKIKVPGMPACQTKLPQPTKARTPPFNARRGGLILGCCRNSRISNLYTVECMPCC